MKTSLYKHAFGCLLFFFMISASTFAQTTQTVRGKVIDQILQTPLHGATVFLDDKPATTDSAGDFRFTEVKAGLHNISVSYIGYKQVFLSNIVINSGKELVLSIPLESNVQLDEVVVKSDSRKNKPLNQMSTVSARAFSVEETQKYAAAVNDPLRMAASFPGVVTAEDGNNDIIIRGNSPVGLLWRMEGVDIPNPNHFSSAGSTGGGISILSAQLLANSDFVTGAFAAEYGNALSGVFDLKLRKGNNERHEYTLQAGLLGLNGTAEGPLSKKKQGSYIINYRYSTLSILEKLGVKLQAGATTNFQDLSYHVHIPTKKGSLSFFGFGGLSNQQSKPEFDSTKWPEESDRYSYDFISNTAVSAAKHFIRLSNKINLTSSIAYSVHETEDNNFYVNKNLDLLNTYKDRFITQKLMLSSQVNYKVNNKTHIRGGFTVTGVFFDYRKQERKTPDSVLNTMIMTAGNTGILQGYAQVNHRFSESFSINAGLHVLHFNYNGNTSVEPRFSVKWDITRSQTVAFGYGTHRQVHPVGTYLYEQNISGNIIQPNASLAFTGAQHVVFSYSNMLKPNLKLRAEIYYQHLSNVPVSIYDTSTFSLINVQESFITRPLVNKGSGRNYGIELSLEKYLSNQSYFILSTSLYKSKYKALDGIERDTRFNGNYAFTLTMGRDFKTKNERFTWGCNFKWMFVGGQRRSPIDPDQSLAKGYTVFREKEAFTIQNPAYVRSDFSIRAKWNKNRVTSIISLDIQNLINRLNVYGNRYDIRTGKIITDYQNGLIPVINYKIEF